MKEHLMRKPRLVTACLSVVAAVAATGLSSVGMLPAQAATGLPAHVLTGYWQDFTNGAKPLRLSQVPTSYNLVAFAFANATGTPGAVSFSVDSGLSSALGGYSDAQFKSDVATLHSHGQKVIISVGGQNGTVSVGDSTSATNFANSVYSIMTGYGFDGVDIDLENGVNPTYMTQALQQLSAKAGSGLIITLAPQTIDMQSTGVAYFQLALNIKSILTIVNTQYYNSGTMNGCNGQVYAEGTEDFLTALACIQLQGGLRPDQVGLGLPASGSAAGSGYVSPSTVNNALDCLAKGTNCASFHPSTTWPAIRGAMDWSINWDAANGYNFANTVAPHLGSLGGSTGGGFPTGYHQFVVNNDSLCIDVSGGSLNNGAAIIQWTCKSSGQTNQEFRFNLVSNGYGELQNENSGKDIVVQSASTSAGAKVIQYTQNGTSNGLWLPVALSNGSWQFKNLNSGLCLDVTGASTSTGVQLQQWTCKSSAAGTNQAFALR
jgi:chitinase